MKYVVIGGAGYIGSHLVQQLYRNGNEVIVFDNFSTGEKLNLPKLVSVVTGDITIYDELSSFLFNNSDADCVFHFAGAKDAGQSMTDPVWYTLNNINGTNNLLMAMADCGIRNLVFSSSAAVYGTPTYLPIDEGHPTNPTNFYGFTKLQTEKLLHWYTKLGKLSCASLRYFNAAGYSATGDSNIPEKNPSNLLPVVMETAIGKRDKVLVFGGDYDTPDGTGVRDYIHVTDLVAAHIMAAQYLINTDYTNNLIFNLGAEQGYSVLDVVNMAKWATGRDIPYEIVDSRPGDVGTVVASSHQIFKTFGWKARHSSLEEILSSMWKIYQGLESKAA